MRKTTQVLSSLLLTGTLGLAGCITIQGETPQGNTKVWVASAYTLTGCQEKLDEEAGHHVEMSEHTQQIVNSVLSYGIMPAYICSGTIAADAASAQATTPAQSLQPAAGQVAATKPE